MSGGYLIVSEIDINEIQKNRYMKFEKTINQDKCHVCAGMEYLNQKYSLIDRASDNVFYFIYFC